MVKYRLALPKCDVTLLILSAKRSLAKAHGYASLSPEGIVSVSCQQFQSIK